MSEKMTCPVCESRTSSVLSAVRDGDPCPYCGAPADLIAQVDDLKARNVDEALVAQLADMGGRLAKAEAETSRLQAILDDVRGALESAVRSRP